jgi:hypothetical protein
MELYAPALTPQLHCSEAAFQFAEDLLPSAEKIYDEPTANSSQSCISKPKSSKYDELYNKCCN